jgi:hypothetical protein
MKVHSEATSLWALEWATEIIQIQREVLYFRGSRGETKSVQQASCSSQRHSYLRWDIFELHMDEHHT